MATSPNDPVSLTSLLSALGGAVAAQLGAMLLKLVREPEQPVAPADGVAVLTREHALMDEWAEIAREARAETAECREERERQRAVIEGLQAEVARQAEATEELRARFAELRTEVHQWRDGRRIPDGYRLVRINPTD